jgi:hypothetical protein
MSKGTQSKTGSLKASALSIGTLLLVSGVDAIAAGNATTGILLTVAGLVGFAAHELLSQREFAFEDDLARAIEDNEVLAREVEAFIRENADTLDASADDLIEPRDD